MIMTTAMMMMGYDSGDIMVVVMMVMVMVMPCRVCEGRVR